MYVTRGLPGRNGAHLPENEFRRLLIYEKGDKHSFDRLCFNIHTSWYLTCILVGMMHATLFWNGRIIRIGSS
jgi:hypothetical protein